MFRSARIKLTGWYLLIIMSISISFSAVIYMGTSREMEKGFHRAELRLKAEELGIRLPRHFSVQQEDLPPRLREVSPPFLFVEDLEAAKERLFLDLLMVNGVILVISAMAGYFLAGQTLRPIAGAMEEQKRFVADASHELRTPLTALKTSMEVGLRDKKASLKETRKIIKSNLEEVEKLRSLSDKLLSLARYQDNGSNFVFTDVEITEVIKAAERKILALAKAKNITLKTKLKKQLISANKESLEEMMVIFLDNAVKYTLPKGRVKVKTGAGKKHLFIEIQDTGIGIVKKDIPHIFNRFYRIDQSRSKTKVSGFGLGLALAKRIISLHKGSVEVSSVLGKGTTFIIKLPLKHS